MNFIVKYWLILYLDDINSNLFSYFIHLAERFVCQWAENILHFLQNSRWFKNYTQGRGILCIIKYLISCEVNIFHIFISLFYELSVLSSERRLLMKHLQAKK